MEGKQLRHGGATAIEFSRRPAAAAAVAVLVACVGALPVPCAGQVYKWVDEKGVTQYSEKPPPGTKAQAIGTPAPRSGVEDKAKPKPDVKTWQQQEIEFKQRQIEAEEKRQKQEAEDAKARRQAALKREGCIDARHNMAVLQEQRPVYEIDEKGERRYLDDKERAENIRKAQQFIDKNCPK